MPPQRSPPLARKSRRAEYDKRRRSAEKPDEAQLLLNNLRIVNRFTLLWRLEIFIKFFIFIWF